jgi:membrane protein DedA with SNARE-associated domain
MSYSAKYTVKERQVVRRIHDLCSYIRGAKIKQKLLKQRIDYLQFEKEQLTEQLSGKYRRRKK